jgi:hypothetical protein
MTNQGKEPSMHSSPINGRKAFAFASPGTVDA